MRDDDKSMTERGMENSVKGKAEHMKGKVKDAVGGLTGDMKMQAEGKLDQAKGKARDALGKAQRELDPRKPDDSRR